MTSRVIVPLSTGYSLSDISRPRMRRIGWAPTLRWRSEALRATTSLSSSAKSSSITAPIGARAPVVRPTRPGLDERMRRLSGRAEHAQDLRHRRQALAHLLETVIAHPAHPLRDRDVANFIRGGALERELPDLARHRHHLVDRDPATVAAATAARTAGGLVGLDVDRGLVAGGAQHLRGDDRALLAVAAERPRQALGEHALDRRGDQEGLDAHLDQAVHCGGSVVGVKRREH